MYESGSSIRSRLVYCGAQATGLKLCGVQDKRLVAAHTAMTTLYASKEGVPPADS